MKVLITGGAGFIGSHLTTRHLGMGDKVAIIDNLSTSTIDNIQHLAEHPDCTYRVDDILRTDVMRELVSDCDLIYHLAAAVGVEYVLENPLKTLTTNIRGTEIVLELAQELKKRVVLASTSEIYGKKNGNVPFREDSDRILGPTTVIRWSYSTTKAVDELLAMAYWREKRLPTVIVRPFNVIGPRQTGRYGMVVPRFIKQAMLGDPITVYDDGEQRRCFTYIDDAIDGLVALAASEDAAGEVFNLGSNFESSIKDLAHKIKEMTNSNSEIVFIPFSQTQGRNGLYEDLVYRAPDLQKIREAVGYDPKVNLDDALSRIIEDFKE
jgi:UDP-glucose 4-epimerase